jgi:transcriptional regulator with XRE-family HTH domain
MHNTINSKFDFSKAIKVLLKDQEMSQEVLSQKTGFSASYISELVRGIKTNPELSTVLEIASAFEVDPIDFFQLSLQTSKCKLALENETSRSFVKIDHLIEEIRNEQNILKVNPTKKKKLELV